jgi:circadian clock protein KaiC
MTIPIHSIVCYDLCASRSAIENQMDERLTSPSSPNSAKQSLRETTGIPGLDIVLGGGLPSHRLYVVEGDPGSGKTTLALQFLQAGVRLRQRVLYVTLSETLEELNDVATSHNWTLDGISVIELNSLSDRLEEDANYTVYHPSDVELGDTIHRITSGG